jgi:hypothetical protein
MANEKVYAAMVAAQKAYGPALKGKKNPHFGNKYADLAACAEAVTDALNANGIALAQVCHESLDGVVVETKFLHESGDEWSGGKLFVPATKKDAQGFGSALTYARRYSLMAACGIAPEDDDGNAASSPATPATPQAAPIDLERFAGVLANMNSVAELEREYKSPEFQARLKVSDQRAVNAAVAARKAALAEREA